MANYLPNSPYIEQGVFQGPVLSPVLFLLIMNPLLRELEESKLGPSILGIYAGAYAGTYALLCDNQTAELSHFEHFITCHSPLVSSESIVELLASGSTDVLVHAKNFFIVPLPYFASLHNIHTYIAVCVHVCVCVCVCVCVMLCATGLYAPQAFMHQPLIHADSILSH